MNLENYQAILTLSEPWDQSFVTFGEIKEFSILNKDGLLFKGENGKVYFLLSRYKNDRIENILKEKILIVAIFEFPYSASTLQSSIRIGDSYIGYGSIKIKT